MHFWRSRRMRPRGSTKMGRDDGSWISGERMRISWSTPVSTAMRSTWRATARPIIRPSAFPTARKDRRPAGWWRRFASELEQVVERLARARRRRRARFTLHRPPRRKDRTVVRGILRTDPHGDRLPALESRARIEGLAMNAGVQIHAAFGAPG